jgi:hypothetical protein
MLNVIAAQYNSSLLNADGTNSATGEVCPSRPC